MNNSIISLILNDKNVNLYTKMLIFLYYKNKDKKYNISDKVIYKYLKLNENDRKKVYNILKLIEKNGYIKIYVEKQKRFFIWKIQEKEDISQLIKNFVEIPDYNWLDNS